MNEQNLTPWKPGQSGNPAGRPKDPWNKLLDEILDSVSSEEQEAALQNLRQDMVENSMASICKKDEIKWPVMRQSFNYGRITFAILKHWLKHGLYLR